MATREEMERQQLAQQQPVAKPNQQGLYTNLEGISDASRQNLNYYSQGYTPSQQVQQAQSYLQGVMDKQPGEYQNSYAGQIKDLYDQIMNRPKFSYDVNKDPLFKSYKDQYIVNGQRAMQDTIGNAAALTGGYGNSWGTTAGYQAYQRYLQALNGVIPELEQRAFERYGAEGDQLQNNLSLAMGLEGQDYGRYRDTLGDWQADRAYARSAYDTEAGRDLENWENMLRLIQNQAALENSDYWNRQDFDFQLRQYEDALNKAKGGSWRLPQEEDKQEEAEEEKERLPIQLRPENKEAIAKGLGDGVLQPLQQTQLPDDATLRTKDMGDVLNRYEDRTGYNPLNPNSALLGARADNNATLDADYIKAFQNWMKSQGTGKQAGQKQAGTGAADVNPFAAAIGNFDPEVQKELEKYLK